MIDASFQKLKNTDMHALIVFCHPEPESFNAELKHVAINVLEQCGYSVAVSDLYGEDFNPVEQQSFYAKRRFPEYFSALAEQRYAFETNNLHSDVKREIARLEKADLVVFQFPIWWHSIPAMMKGWMDRVFVNGGLYTSSMRYDRGYFRGKKAVCSATTGAPPESFEPGGRGGEIQQILWSTHYSLYYMGFDVLPPQIAYGVQGHGYSYASEDAFFHQMTRAKTNLETRLPAISDEEPLSFRGWDEWDEMGRLTINHAMQN